MICILYKLFISLLFFASLPLQMIIAMVIFLTSGFPIVYGQKRVGKSGQVIILYKFRTMIAGADTLQKKYQKYNEAFGPVFKIRNDPRFTRFGKFLSHTGLDELPQLFNVLKGDMALIGPRPLPISETQKLKPWQKKRQGVLPGIISPWILDGYHTSSFDEWMRSDITYVKNKSLWYDLKLTIKAIIFLTRLFIRELFA